MHHWHCAKTRIFFRIWTEAGQGRVAMLCSCASGGVGVLLSVLFSLVIFSGSGPSAYGSPKIQSIYGEDGRHDRFQVHDLKWQEPMRSSGALIWSTDLHQNPDGSFLAKGETFEKYFQLCPGQRFADQLTSAFCSGVLVAPDVFLTAGHCVGSKKRVCSQIRIAFDYAINAPAQTYNQLSAENVYSCAKIIHHQEKGDQDFALIQLDRPVVGRTPVQVPVKSNVLVGTYVTAIGHPSGLPQKVTDGGLVRSLGEGFFQTNLDTFTTNSGSPVFNSTSTELEGVLISGEEDFIFDSKRKCYELFRCPDELGCGGEWVTDIGVVAPVLSRYLR